MKTKSLLLIAVLLLLFGCDKEKEYSSPYSCLNEYAVYQTSDETVFREFLLILKPYVSVDSQKKYLAIDSITNVTIKINNKDWGSFTSLDVESTLFDTELNDGIVVTDDEVKYAVIVPFQTSKDTLTTAGEYSDLLNNQFTIDPGFYIFEIESFEFKLVTGEVLKVKTPIVEPVEITENSRNVFVGEFEIKIN